MGDIDFARTMSRYPDEEVIRIACLGDDDGYESEAITAAKAELAKRQISRDAIDETLADQAHYEATKIPKVEIPMSPAGRIFYAIFAFFLFIPAIVVAILIESNGYKRKAREAWISISIGIGVLAVLVIPMIVFWG
jgi:hypothetical protein